MSEQILKPNFFLVGAPRCGTTAMYAYLRAHPQIFMPEQVKEPHFFAPEAAPPNMKPYADRERYLALFAGAGDVPIIGEASTHYLAAPNAPRAIHDFNPQARILVMLRAPVDLLYSLYYHRLRFGTESHPTFEAAMADDHFECGDPQPPRSHYRHLPCFATQLQRYFETFGREAVHVIIFDDFRTDTPGVYRQTLDFLGVDPAFQPSFEPANENRLVRLPQVRQFIRRPPGWYRALRAAGRRAAPGSFRRRLNASIDEITLEDTSRPKMNPALRRELQQAYLPEIERLSAMLGRDLTHWCRD